MPATLSPEQLSFYKCNGYLHVPGVIPSDLLGLMQTVSKASSPKV